MAGQGDAERRGSAQRRRTNRSCCPSCERCDQPNARTLQEADPEKALLDIDDVMSDVRNQALAASTWPRRARSSYDCFHLEATGTGHRTPWTECWPSGVPFIFQDIAMQILQQPDKVTIVYEGSFRQVRMNQPHPAQVAPSWYGDSVGHYEGDILVIDTVGIKIGPYSMVGLYGTPYTNALHVVERYRLLDYEATKGALDRVANENFRLPPDTIGIDVVRNYRGNGLQLEFTVDDDGVFTTPWSATITYRRGINSRGTDEWVEFVCAENPHLYYAGRDIDAPTAEKPDF
jgi:hypothetical protein